VSLALALTLVAAAPGLADTPTHAVALIYHHVDAGTPGATSVRPELFVEHLDHLAGGGHTVMGLEEVVAALRGGGDLPDRAVVLTFDDGYRSVYETAYPLLKARGWPFTVFVCPEGIDERRGPVMTWDQLREMAGNGATIANHGLRHDILHRRADGETDADWAARTRAELVAAHERIAHEIGRSPALLAYPYGEYDADLQAIVRDLGWAAFGQQSGAMGELSDLTALPRFPMAGSFAAMENFPVKVSCLPLPVLEAQSAGPLLPAGVGVVKPRPALRLTLAEGDYRASQLAAYASGQGRIELTWIDEEARVLEVRANEPLGTGRSRYNVTAPATDGRRYYWYSYTWIVGNNHKD
jgi:peptidoglycan/xylan/chitin deacetylase (PgdA/CDA1 family)